MPIKLHAISRTVYRAAELAVDVLLHFSEAPGQQEV